MNAAQEYKTYHPKEVAVLIRGELKQKFPKQKFSVKCTTYGCIQVSWKDGVSYNAVESVTSIFGGRGFDGMTDSTTYTKKMYHGELCQFYTYAPDLSRDLSPEFALCIADAVATENSYSAIVVNTNRDGSSYFGGLCDDWDNNQAAIIRCLSRSIDQNSYSSDEILIKLRTIERAYGPMGILDRLALHQTLDTIKRDLDSQPLSHDIDLTQFADRYSSDPVAAKPVLTLVKPVGTTIVPDPVPQQSGMTIEGTATNMISFLQALQQHTDPDPVPQPTETIESKDFYDTQIEIDYHDAIVDRLASGELHKIVTFEDFKASYYSSLYKRWVLAAIEQGAEATIVSIEDWIADVLPTL